MYNESVRFSSQPEGREARRRHHAAFIASAENLGVGQLSEAVLPVAGSILNARRTPTARKGLWQWSPVEPCLAGGAFARPGEVLSPTRTWV